MARSAQQKEELNRKELSEVHRKKKTCPTKDALITTNSNFEVRMFKFYFELFALLCLKVFSVFANLRSQSR